MSPPPRNFSKTITLPAAPVLLATLLVSCGAPQPRANEVVVALESAPLNLDPRLATDQASARIMEAMLGGLVVPDPEGTFQGDLAESWEVLDDGLRYRFHLRPGVTFHDGRPFGARDVVWTYGSLLDGSVTSAKTGAFPQVKGFVEVGPLTVDCELSEPYGALLVNFTSYVGIVPHGSDPDSFNRKPVGTGPFRLIERSPEKVVLEAFDGFWAGRPALDRVVFKHVPDATIRTLELHKGSTHLVANDLPPDVVAKLRDDPEFQVVESPGSNYAYVGLNLEDPILSDVRVRRALAHAIDRPKLLETIWRGLGTLTETMIRPGHWAHNERVERIPYDPARARELLDEAGYPDPQGPEPRFRLTFKTSTRETFVLQAQGIQSMLAEVGIEVAVRSFEFATFYNDIKQGNFQLFTLIWTGVIDPDIYSYIFRTDRIPPDGANRGRYRNPEIDRLTEEGVRRYELAERRPYYLEAQEILARDLPYISLFIRSNYGVMPTELQGFRNYPSGELYSLREMYWR